MLNLTRRTEVVPTIKKTSISANNLIILVEFLRFELTANVLKEYFNKTILNEYYQITLRKMYCGRTPLDTLLDGKSIWVEKNLAHI